ncbi:MAG: putative porin, partial [Raineya sp.]
ALFLRAGIDGYFRTQYFADAYMPVMKQFYLQDAVLMRTYPVFDIFASIRIRKTRAFVKMSHINEGLMPAPHGGYEMTPFYAGLRRTFSLGLSWKLYD